MLSFLRNKNLSNVVYGVVIIGTVAAFAINFGPGAGKQSKSLKEAFNENCALRVGNRCVSPQEHRAAYTLLTPVDQTGAKDANRARQMKLWSTVAEGLAERELLIKEAERVGLTVTEQEVTDSIFHGFIYFTFPSDNPMRSSYIQGDDSRLNVGFKDRKTKEFSEKAYREQVRYFTRLTPTEFRDWQQKEMLAAKMRDIIRAPVRVSDEESFGGYVRERTNATVEYVEVKTDYVARYMTQVNAGDVDTWLKDATHKALVDKEFEGMKATFLPKDNKHIRHILVKVAPNANAQDQAKAKAKLGRAWAMLKSGAAFASVAKEFSEDGSAGQGGDVGDDTKGFVSSFRIAADALKPGEMTDGAIQSEFGYHIIAKDDASKASAIEGQLKKDLARQMVSKERSESEAKVIAGKLQTAWKAGQSFDEALKAAIEPLVKNKQAEIPDVKIKPFEETPPPGAKVGDAGAAKDGAAGPADAGATAAASADAGAKPNKDAPKAPAVPAFTAETDPDKPKIETSQSFNRSGDPISTLAGEESAKLMEFAFAAADGAVSGDLLHSFGGLVIAKLKERKAATKESFEKDKDAFTEALLTKKRNEALAAYVKRLREERKNDIKLFPEFMVDAKSGDAGASSAPVEDDEP
ncbi:MAG: peptidylprolyl isomerase [Polyangiaceae bacterium]